MERGMILFLLILITSVSASAQMADLMGNLTIDNAMNIQTVKGYNTANLQVKKNNLSQELQIKNMEIQALMISNPQNVSRETFSVLGYVGSAKLENGGGFSITLRWIEQPLCQLIGNKFAESKKTKINENNICSDKNIIKFYY